MAHGWRLLIDAHRRICFALSTTDFVEKVIDAFLQTGQHFIFFTPYTLDEDVHDGKPLETIRSKQDMI